ncbi:hypothetical protein, partial [Noviherbaspirillum autotrophicum]|uniref:hypothetical protein n=1 Tax=Noviherbaspirillum autotrophicum TaxID=709839 RepID=UPI001E30A743
DSIPRSNSFAFDQLCGHYFFFVDLSKYAVSALNNGGPATSIHSGRASTQNTAAAMTNKVLMQRSAMPFSAGFCGTLRWKNNAPLNFGSTHYVPLDGTRMTVVTL